MSVAFQRTASSERAPLSLAAPILFACEISNNFRSRAPERNFGHSASASYITTNAGVHRPELNPANLNAVPAREGDIDVDTYELQDRKAAKTTIRMDSTPEQVKDLSSVLNALLADLFALYLKTKNFHWHMSGPHFRDYHLLLDEQADQIFKLPIDIAERVRKIGGPTIRSIGHIARLQRIADND